MHNRFSEWCVAEAGATLVEYGIALLVVIFVGAAVMGGLGQNSQLNIRGACEALDGTC